VKRCVSGKREARGQADLLRLGSASKGGGARAEACEAVWAGRAGISQRIAGTASPENLVCRHDRLRDAPWPKAAMAESAELASPSYTGCTEDREMRSGLALLHASARWAALLREPAFWQHLCHPGVSGTLPQPPQENGEDAATHQGGCEQPACEGERKRVEAHTE
jgi:hypothetical protein